MLIRYTVLIPPAEDGWSWIMNSSWRYNIRLHVPYDFFSWQWCADRSQCPVRNRNMNQMYHILPSGNIRHPICHGHAIVAEPCISQYILIIFNNDIALLCVMTCGSARYTSMRGLRVQWNNAEMCGWITWIEIWASAPQAWSSNLPARIRPIYRQSITFYPRWVTRLWHGQHLKNQVSA